MIQVPETRDTSVARGNTDAGPRSKGKGKVIVPFAEKIASEMAYQVTFP